MAVGRSFKRDLRQIVARPHHNTPDGSPGIVQARPTTNRRSPETRHRNTRRRSGHLNTPDGLRGLRSNDVLGERSDSSVSFDTIHLDITYQAPVNFPEYTLTILSPILLSILSSLHLAS